MRGRDDDAFVSGIEAAIAADDPEELLGVIIDLALAAEDGAWAETCCARLAAHQNTDVRGNAMIGFAHLAERFGSLDRAGVEPLLQAGLRDRELYVREQSEAALEIVRERLGW